jgi:hypothetical protein
MSVKNYGYVKVLSPVLTSFSSIRHYFYSREREIELKRRKKGFRISLYGGRGTSYL